MKRVKNKAITFNEKDIPKDVWFVWCLEYINYPIGTELFEKIESIKKKHPKYFNNKPHAKGDIKRRLLEGS